MSTRLLNRKSAIVTLAAATVLVGGVAYGYPSDTAMSVSATASPEAGGTRVLVSVMNANPACQIRVRVDGGNEMVLPVTGTTASTSYLITPALSGRHDVRARTVDCTHGTQKEHAKNKFVVADGAVTGPATAKNRKNFRVDITGVPEGTPVSLVATAPDGTTRTEVPGDVGTTTDKRGEADLRVNLDVPGTWSIVVTAEPAGELSSTIGTVTTVVS